MDFKFRGLMPPVFTPFKADFSLDLDKIPEYMSYLHNEKKVQGILVCGTSGEGPSMSVEERKLVAETWVKEARKYNIHVMIQVGGAPLPDVIALAKHAEELKVDSILTLPELYIKAQTVDDLVHYLNIVSAAAPNTPLFYYHIPMFVDLKLSMPEMVTKAKKSVKTFKGIKYTSNDLVEGEATLRACGKDCVIFLGADSVLLDAFKLGFDSGIGTMFNMTTLGSDIAEAFSSNSSSKAQQYQNSLNAAITSIAKYGSWVQTMKVAMGLLTKLDMGPIRPPQKSLDQADVKDMTEGLAKLGFKIYH